MSNYEELLKKVKRLAEKGESGESANAKLLLDKLAKKHNISIEQLEENTERQHFFEIPVKYHKLFYQIVAYVNGDVDVYGLRSSKRTMIFTCTDAKAVETQYTFDFYRAKYEEEVKIHYRAFIHVNRLFSKDDNGSLLIGELSKEEQEEMKKVAKLAMMMDKHSINKAIEQ